MIENKESITVGGGVSMETKLFPFLYENEMNEYFSIQIPKETIIFQEGDDCSSVAFVVSGVIRVSKISENGKEVNLYRVCRGESCVLTISSVLSNSPFPATAVVEKDVEAILVPKEIFRKMMTTNDELRQFTYQTLMGRFMTMMHMIEDIVFQKMDKRIIELLYTQFKHHHSDVIEITHEFIANELGTAREVVSRILKHLEREGYIKLARGKIKLLNIEALCDKLETM